MLQYSNSKLKVSKQLMTIYSSLEEVIKDEEQFVLAADGSDIFLELFANDFCRITQTINNKRKARGRDDIYKNKLNALDHKIHILE